MSVGAGRLRAMAALALIALIASTAVSGSAEASRPLARSDADRIEAARHDRGRVPANCPYSKLNAAYPPPKKFRACVRYAGAKRRVLVVGDSHAEHWMPALVKIAQQRGWQLRSLTRPGCGPLGYVAVRERDRRNPTVGEQCAHWRRQVYPRVISRFDPDLVIFGGRTQAYNIATPHGVARRLNTDAWLSAWTKSWAWTVQTLHARGASLAALTLQPNMKGNVPSCLMREGLRSGRCNTRKGADVLTTRLNRLVTAMPQRYRSVHAVRVTEVMCPHGICRALIDNAITHRDNSHVTRSFTIDKWRAVRTRLVRADVVKPR